MRMATCLCGRSGPPEGDDDDGDNDSDDDDDGAEEDDDADYCAYCEHQQHVI